MLVYTYSIHIFTDTSSTDSVCSNIYRPMRVKKEERECEIRHSVQREGEREQK